MSDKIFDVVIVGSGAAGLTAALHLADRFDVAVLAKGSISDGSTAKAQGGIAAVLDAGDNFENHIKDTFTAGAGLNRRSTVEYVVEHAPEAIEHLAEIGVPFNPGNQFGERWHLTREGGHSHRRIVHVDDATGLAVQKALQKAAHAHPRIRLIPDMAAIDLISGRHCQDSFDSRDIHGVYAYNSWNGKVQRFLGRATILATGGAGQVYQHSTAPKGATGDGIAMAWRAGARVSNLEFNQFHPTALYNPEGTHFLITEAMRGEGGQLKIPTDGHRFMPDFDERNELAPRDIVARAIDHEIKRLGLNYVYLDISHRPAEFIEQHFPTIRAHLLEQGIDITTQPIPVVPAMHYTCGGVLTDINGRTDLPGLYAIGEVAQSGLHGANRLASNSLLECLVFGEAAARHITENWDNLSEPPVVRPWDDSRVTNSDEEIVVQHNWHEIRRAMWDYVGIVRSNKRLMRARHRLDNLAHEIADYYGNFHVSPELIELRNLIDVAGLVVRCALSRKESRGLHFNLDYPDTLPVAVDTVLTP
ncbi:L-aspartate oxidase [Zymomonas mobilis]|uniref:L-aspartate oxidase n=1 Tax=Zymomonas mobilis TaxID=542 RepID=UPI00026D8045|nr:L-aspartate oxidase [Zymomonas mobilis]AFN56949.1 L-aspartate oxidase [Zymomonas mobilis subsp. mobilis ATCC 29191]TQK77614.1 L-aspartate oxidase [Zymomonas mobilis]TQL15736.1 L-aspartate oxidase [Zymomonas mobilis]GEB87831.1 L-aspartate oxidase [Zymomonas mobilis subsp. mobilis]